MCYSTRRPKLSSQPRLILTSELQIDCAEFAAEAKRVIKEEMIKLNRDGVAVALDSGLGPAVVAVLAVQAVGADRVHAVIPRDQDVPAQQIESAIRLANSLRIRYTVIDIGSMLSKLGVRHPVSLWAALVEQIKEWLAKRVRGRGYVETTEPPLAMALLGTRGMGNSQVNRLVAYRRARVRQRVVVLYYYAELKNLLVLGNCNKTDRTVGGFVKYGDIAADVAPIEGLFRTQVAQLASFLGLPTEPDSPLLAADQASAMSDEGITGMPDDLLDRTLIRIERGLDSAAIATYLGIETEQVEHVRRLIRHSQHMRSQPKVPGHG